MIAEKKKREFRMHSNLLKEVIKKQTGSIDRAIQEAVSNSVDSNATAINIEVSGTKIVITDDGKGFTSEEEITDVFETFGKPHAVTEAKKFGKFRMGRGQLFAHGRNTWRTNEFVMEVDIDNPDESKEDHDELGHGLGYSLHRSEKVQPGCQITIELYNPMTVKEVVELNETIADAFKYLATTVKLNGRKINVNPHSVKWEYQNDFFVANINLERKNLRVFNQGVHVCTYNYDRFYVSGDVCTTVDMELNFARNEPMNDCMVWKSIRDRLPEIREDLLEKKRIEREKQEEEERKLSRRNGPPREKREPSEYQKNKPSLSVQQRRVRFTEIVRAGKLIDETYDASQPIIRPFCAKSKKKLSWISPVKILRDCTKTQCRIGVTCEGSASFYKFVKAAKLNLITLVCSDCIQVSYLTVQRPAAIPTDTPPSAGAEGEVTLGTVISESLDESQQLQTLLNIVNRKTNTVREVKVLNSADVDKLLDAYEVRMKKENLDFKENVLHQAIQIVLSYFEPSIPSYELEIAVCLFGNDDVKMKYVKREDGSKPILLINRKYLKDRNITYSGCISIIRDIFLTLEPHRPAGQKLKRDRFPLWVNQAAYRMLEEIINAESRDESGEHLDGVQALKLSAARAIDKINAISELSFSRAMAIAKLKDARDFIDQALRKAENDNNLTIKDILTCPYRGELSCKLTPELKQEFDLLEKKNVTKKTITLGAESTSDE